MEEATIFKGETDGEPFYFYTISFMAFDRPHVRTHASLVPLKFAELLELIKLEFQTAYIHQPISIYRGTRTGTIAPPEVKEQQ